MDLVEIPKVGKTWRIQIGPDGKLAAKEVSAAAAGHKLVKVVGKHTIRGGKVQVALHDGRTLLADNAVKVGSTLQVSVPAFKINKALPLESGVRCLITSGKHAGEMATLEKIIERVGSMDSEASLKSGNESFVTVTKYLFVVDNEFA
ncbi:30S ribosomal protein S4e [uncultured archaeon]|nr:30S ribosomal protein S4e [uncultured archaeon]